MTLTPQDRTIVEATQAGLPLVTRPFAVVAESLGLSEAELIDRLKQLKAQGVIRRIGAAPNHYRLGMTANGMTVWDVDDAVVDSLGEKVGALPFVTHCYRRPRALPDWPYNLFAMVHGETREEVIAKRAEISSLLGKACRAGDILFSTRILKKTGMRLRGKEG
ncbi:MULTISPECIES: Lrp/AsnC family transcriptional regulator [Stappiaceae]|uniref:siroheme decarboxylase subunit beta n=1 Tax=Stappiaceae TaxID=2821832 RepID=UPI0003B85FF0|nr:MULTISPECIES: Lrp/AsnC family transcriptional regulator [Stappiaceae]MCR9285070.1 Lrp/AsnC family transcriptional regulator [Paracoccaceae bacterium]MEC9401603.1 Lrp/AsnC family transcriptional regulator [Pseudomonadota bacterium]ERP90913.1 protein nirH [Labrenzia sp. C1B10]ERS08641.1 protein nirH [Labrenzia sp. C1B70]MBN8184568.1 Lrp/AsnC family transcriptional regulator [Roseibium aggregatum]